MTAPGRYFAISDAERSLICLRLVIEALAEHEKYSDSETDWESLYHMAEISTGLVQALDQMRQDAWQETDGARAEAKRLQQQLDAQQQGVDAMRAQVERLQKLADTVRSASSYFRGSTEWHKIEDALAELDAQPAPVAETAEGGT